jgi:EpsI family protein
MNRIAISIALLMFAASVVAHVTRPVRKAADIEPAISLEAMIPKAFGDWREEPQRLVQVINPQAAQLIDKIYSQVLARAYVNSEGYRIMISLAYGSDQRGELQAHKPEVCYPAHGFTVHKNESSQIMTPFGKLALRRLYTTMGQRQEPVSYWFAVGGTPVQGRLQKRLVDLKYGFTGRIPDGMLFRVSSIDPDQSRANRYQDHFINQLLQTIPTTDRKRLSGLGDS